MAYEMLTTKTVIPYFFKTAAGRAFFENEDSSQFEAKEIGDGNLNLVFIISNIKTKKSLILKQALPYLRCAGEGYPLAKERMHYEIRALIKLSVFAPANIPKIYHTDFEMCLVVMQYLDNHVILRKGMIQGIYYPEFANHISSFLAETLFKTSSLYLESTYKAQLIKDFNQNELRKLTENFVFTFAFMPHETNKISQDMLIQANNLWLNSKFKKNVLRLKDLFMNKTDALLHGDLHTGSIMVNNSETYVIDPEFAFVGPFGFDLGAVLANLIMSWVSHFERSYDNSYQNKILLMIQEFLLQFELKFISLWNKYPASPLLEKQFLSSAEFHIYQQQFMKNILRDTIGFAGCKIVRRQLGLAGVDDIRGISDPKAMARAERMALAIGKHLVIHHQQFNSIEDLIIVLKKFGSHHIRSSRTELNFFSKPQMQAFFGNYMQKLSDHTLNRMQPQSHIPDETEIFRSRL